MVMNRNWEQVAYSEKAAVWYGERGGRMVYVVTIGMGNKIPADNPAYPNRDTAGNLILKGSHWTFAVLSLDKAAAAKAAALNLYNNVTNDNTVSI